MKSKPSILSSLIRDSLHHLEQRGLKRNLLLPEGIDFASNDTLGLSTHPHLIEKAQEYALMYGVGSGSSRLVSGNSRLFETIEQKIATFKGKEAALLFSSGFQANSSVLQSILGLPSLHPPSVFIDRLAHASLVQGCRSAGVVPRPFRHNDLNHLEDCLKQAQGPRFIISESVFSMDGDRCDLEGLISLKNRYDAFLYIDEAHATGVYGPEGRGLACHREVDVVMGTFSKAMGSFGAYVACDASLKEFLITSCIGFIYTTALPPIVLGSIEGALDLVPTLNKERNLLTERSHSLRSFIQCRGGNIGNSSTHIVPLIIGDTERAMATSQHLKSKGFHIPSIRPPTVSKDTSRLRISLKSVHTPDQMQKLYDALGEIL